MFYLTAIYQVCNDDIIKWKYFPRYWPFVRGIHWSPVNSHQKGQWRGALMFSLICAWINCWVNNRDSGNLRRHRCSLWRHCNVWYCRCPSMHVCDVFDPGVHCCIILRLHNLYPKKRSPHDVLTVFIVGYICGVRYRLMILCLGLLAPFKPLRKK